MNDDFMIIPEYIKVYVNHGSECHPMQSINVNCVYGKNITCTISIITYKHLNFNHSYFYFEVFKVLYRDFVIEKMIGVIEICTMKSS